MSGSVCTKYNNVLSLSWCLGARSPLASARHSLHFASDDDTMGSLQSKVKKASLRGDSPAKKEQKAAVPESKFILPAQNSMLIPSDII